MIFLGYIIILFPAGIDIKTTASNDKNAVSATEIKFRGKGPVTRSLEPLSHKYKGMPLSVSLAPEKDPSKLAEVSEK